MADASNQGLNKFQLSTNGWQKEAKEIATRLHLPHGWEFCHRQDVAIHSEAIIAMRKSAATCLGIISSNLEFVNQLGKGFLVPSMFIL